jgi:predicted RNA-binding Zn ribbon-like protein
VYDGVRAQERAERKRQGTGTAVPGARPPAAAPTFHQHLQHRAPALGLPDEEFASPAGLRRWLRAHGLWPRGARLGRGEVSRVRRVREALRCLLLAHNGAAVDAGAVRVLNRAARDARLGVRVRPDGRLEVEADAPGLAGVLGRLVAAAFTAQTDGTWQRLKACRRCQWAFYDRSRNRSGRWCAMSICGNRTKARTYRSRHRPGRRR